MNHLEGGRPYHHPEDRRPQPEPAKPQHERGEGQPLPSARDVLQRWAQLNENRKRELIPHEHKHSREYLVLRRKHHEKLVELEAAVSLLYDKWPDRDRLTFDLYTATANWRWGLSGEETRHFIAKVAPLSNEELAEELRTAREALERKAARYKKMTETQRRNRSLTPEERERLAKENDRERSRRWRQANPKKLEKYALRAHQMRRNMREEFGRHLQADESQPTQVFPLPANE
jgi:hypothetical protein